MLWKSWEYLDTELEAREEWNKFVFEIKAGKSPQSLAESKALRLLVMQESRPHKTPNQALWESNKLKQVLEIQEQRFGKDVSIQKSRWTRSLNSIVWGKNSRQVKRTLFVRSVSWPVRRRIETPSAPRSIWRLFCSSNIFAPPKAWNIRPGTGNSSVVSHVPVNFGW